MAKQLVEKHRGHIIKSTGDGILVTFDGRGRAVRCAMAFTAAAEQIGLRVRASLHTGEIEARGRDIVGIAVHAAARVMAQCQPSEVLISRVVTDLVAGAGLKYSERGSHELKGIRSMGLICRDGLMLMAQIALSRPVQVLCAVR